MSNEKCNIQRKNLRKAHLSECNLENAILKEKNLRKANLTGANLTGAEIQEADLTKAEMQGANLTGAKLQKAILIGCDLSKAKISGANFKGADLEDAILKGVDLSDSVFDGANLRGVDFRETIGLDKINLKGRFLQKANFSENNMQKINLTDAKMQEADLTRTKLSKAILNGAKLEGAYLTRAILVDAKLNNADLTGADLQGAVLADAELQGTILNGTNLRGCNLQWTDLRESILMGAGLRDTNLEDNHLESVNLTRADLRGAHLSGAHLNGANLTGSDLRDAVLEGADLTGAIITNTTRLERANLIDAILTNTILDPNIALPPPPPPQGRAFEIHNVFSMIDLQKLQEFMDSFASEHNLNPKIIPDIISNNDDNIFMVFENFIKKSNKFSTHDDKRENIIKLMNIYNLIKDSKYYSNNKKLIIDVVLFVCRNNDEFIEQYIRILSDECLNAYGQGQVSCVKGMVERLLTTIGSVAEVLTIESEGEPHYVELKKIFNKVEFNDLVQEWANTYLEDGPKHNEIIDLSVEDRKKHFINFITEKYNGTPLYQIKKAEIDEKIMSEANKYEQMGVFKNMYFGGKKRKSMRKRNKHSKKVTKKSTKKQTRKNKK